MQERYFISLDTAWGLDNGLNSSLEEFFINQDAPAKRKTCLILEFGMHSCKPSSKGFVNRVSFVSRAENLNSGRSAPLHV
jgi:hypothetical protein